MFKRFSKFWHWRPSPETDLRGRLTLIDSGATACGFAILADLPYGAHESRIGLIWNAIAIAIMVSWAVNLIRILDGKTLVLYPKRWVFVSIYGMFGIYFGMLALLSFLSVTKKPEDVVIYSVVALVMFLAIVAGRRLEKVMAATTASTTTTS